MMEIRTLDQDKNNNHLSVFRSNDGDIFVTVYEQKDRNSLRVPHTVRIGSANSGHKRPSDILVALSHLAEYFERYENCDTEDEALMKEVESAATPSVDYKIQGFGQERDLFLSFVSAVYYARDNGYKGKQFDKFLHRHFMKFHPAENGNSGFVSMKQRTGNILKAELGNTMNDFVLSVRNGTEDKPNHTVAETKPSQTITENKPNQTIKEDKPYHTIKESLLSPGVKNLLNKNGYYTLEKIATLPEKELASIKGIGPAKLEEIKKIISTLNTSE